MIVSEKTHNHACTQTHMRTTQDKGARTDGQLLYSKFHLYSKGCNCNFFTLYENEPYIFLQKKKISQRRTTWLLVLPISFAVYAISVCMTCTVGCM